MGGGGYWRLEMRLGLVLGYGNAFGVESVQWEGGGGYPPPPFQAIPGGGSAWGFGARGWRGQRGGMRRAWDSAGPCRASSTCRLCPLAALRNPARPVSRTVNAPAHPSLPLQSCPSAVRIPMICENIGSPTGSGEGGQAGDFLQLEDALRFVDPAQLADVWAVFKWDNPEHPPPPNFTPFPPIFPRAPPPPPFSWCWV